MPALITTHGAPAYGAMSAPPASSGFETAQADSGGLFDDLTTRRPASPGGYASGGASESFRKKSQQSNGVAMAGMLVFGVIIVFAAMLGLAIVLIRAAD